VKKIYPLVFAASLVLVALTNAGEPWQEPEDFRGLKWGASVEEMRKVFPLENELREMRSVWAIPTLVGNRIKRFTVSNIKIGTARTTLYIGFLDDRFAYVWINFNSRDFVELREAFITRYGPAHSMTVERLKNRMGAEFENPVLTWEGNTLAIRLANYSGTLTEGAAQLGKHEYVDELLRVQNQRGKDAAKG
jgi:hypothetical protein